jgi:membrane associated rhomboid family serine protease
MLVTAIGSEPYKSYLLSNVQNMGLYDRDYYQEPGLQPIQSWNSRSIVSTLIIINVVVFLANFILGSGSHDTVNQFLWLRSDHLLQPWQWYRLLTNGFCHAGIGHIFFNMLALYFLGQSVESRYGRGEFLRIFLVAVVLCSSAWVIRQLIILDSTSEVRVLLGASGGVTAITMLFVFNYPQSTLYIWGVLPVKAWVIGILVVGANLLGNSSIQVGESEHVAYDVHLVGAAFAAVYFYGKLNLGLLGSLGEKAAGLFRRKPKLKIHQPTEEVAQDKLQVEADRILEKIHREGQDSLTTKERKTLEEYSRSVRKQRQR